MGNLYFGDNLDILRNHLQDASVDLIYLDPPFNSKRNYNILFKTPKGQTSEASVTAFEDTWHWGGQAEHEFDEILNQPNTNVSAMMEALRNFLGENDLMAYLVMMCNRLLELHRVLKPTGSLYLHCDPTASHYLKIVLDGIFGKEFFRNEIIWRRSGSHNSAKKYGPIHDVILFYTKSKFFSWKKVYKPYLRGYIASFFKKEDGQGRYRSQTLTGSGIRNGKSGEEWRGYNPTPKGRHWAFPGILAEELDIQHLTLHEKLDYLYEEGLLARDMDGLPEYKQYLHQSKGVQLQDIWSYQPYTQGCLHDSDEAIDDDVRWLDKRGRTEKLGYPTQKPLGLLDRIINVSCPDGGVLLDPFCGCGTAIHAAEKLGRQWLGIDITHLAISVIEERLRKHFPEVQFETHGTPKDFDAARDLARRDKYEFQYWVCHLLGAQPYQNKKKGADGGIDGIIYFKDIGSHYKKIIVSVKGGENVNVAMVRDLGHVVAREKAEIGVFITLADPTRPMREEATKAGFYTPPFVGKKFPKLQIITVEGMLKGTERPEYPSLERGGVPVKKPKGQAKDQMSFMLPYNGTKQDEIEVEVTVPAIDGYHEPSVNQATELPAEKATRSGKGTLDRNVATSYGRRR